MKTKITTVLLGLITSISFGQMTFVKTINYSSIEAPISSLSIDVNTDNITEIGKYILAEPAPEVDDYSWGKQTEFDLLDTEFNFYKKIVIDTSHSENGTIRISGPWISDHLFNLDDKIEYQYVLNLRYEDTINGWGTEEKVIRTVIADEDNNILMSMNDERFYMEDIFFFGGKTYVNTRNSEDKIKLYEVSGSMPCIQCNTSSSSANKSQPIAAKPEYSFQISPNPVNDNLNIETDLDESNMEIKIYTTSGQLLQTEAFFSGSNQVNVSSLVSGTYVINVISGNKFLHTEQFIKQ